MTLILVSNVPSVRRRLQARAHALWRPGGEHPGHGGQGVPQVSPQGTPLTSKPLAKPGCAGHVYARATGRSASKPRCAPRPGIMCALPPLSACFNVPPRSLWFTPRLEAVDGEDAAPVERSAADRAQQLADVALAVYEAGGRGIHLPLDQAHPLVAVLRAALGVGARGDLKVGLHVCIKKRVAGHMAAGCMAYACKSRNVPCCGPATERLNMLLARALCRRSGRPVARSPTRCWTSSSLQRRPRRQVALKSCARTTVCACTLPAGCCANTSKPRIQSISTPCPAAHLQAGEQAGFKHLLSLHAFAVTDVELCMPPKDPFKFVRSLAPYLKVAGGVQSGPGEGMIPAGRVPVCTD